MMTLSDLKQVLFERGDGYAIDMIEMIEGRAEKNEGYRTSLDQWLDTGNTVILRDDICGPFEHSSLIDYLKPKIPMPFFNCWAAIDSAWLRAKSAEARQ